MVVREWHESPRTSDLQGLSNRLRVLFQARCIRRVLPLARAADLDWLEFAEHALSVAEQYVASVPAGVTKVKLLKAAGGLDTVGTPAQKDLVARALSNALSYMLAQAAADPDLPENRGIAIIEDADDRYPAHDAAVLAVVSAASEAGFEICDDVWRDLTRLMAAVNHGRIEATQ